MPQFPITVFKVKFLKPCYKSGFRDLHFLLHIFIGMTKITFFSVQWHKNLHPAMYHDEYICPKKFAGFSVYQETLLQTTRKAFSFILGPFYFKYLNKKIGMG